MAPRIPVPKRSKVKKPIKNKPDGYVCDHCMKTYKTEGGFMRHVCPVLARKKELTSKYGMMAYSYYAKWLRYRRLTPPSPDTFGTSNYFNSFVKFAKWVKKSKINNPNEYMKYVVMKKMAPAMWYNTEVYASYLEFVDRRWSVEDHADQTIRFLQKFGRRIADDLPKDQRPDNIIQFALSELTIGEMVRFIVNRSVSPWVLLNSTIFKNKFMESSTDKQQAISSAMNITYWTAKMANNPKDNQFIRDIVSGFKL